MAGSKVLATIRLELQQSGELVINAKIAGGMVISRSITRNHLQTVEQIQQIIDRLYAKDVTLQSPAMRRLFEDHLSLDTPNEPNGSTS